MNGIYGFFLLVAVGFGLFVALIVYNAIKLWIFKFNNSIAISVFEQYGYRFYSTHSYKGKGLIYRKRLDNETTNALLLHYGYEALDLDAPYRIFDYVALVKYPEWEEYYGSMVAVHGGLRLYHFYEIEIPVRNKIYYRPYSFYLDNDMKGELLPSINAENKTLISNHLTNDMRGVIAKFHEDEIAYWKNKMRDI